MLRNHRLISFFLISFMLLFSLPPQFASAANPVSYSINIVNDKPISIGDEIQVAIQGNNLVDVFAYEVNLDFDPSILEFKAKTDNTELPGYSVHAIVDPIKGHLQFAHSRIGAVSGDSGNLGLVNLTFIAKKVGTASIEVRDVKLVDSNLEATVSNTGSQKSIEILSSPAIVASSITTILAPSKDETKLVLPDVLLGFTVAIESSSYPTVIGIDGKIVPPIAETTVNLVLEVTRTLDGKKASTISIPVKVPARSVIPKTAEDIAKTIISITAPAKDETKLALPKVPDEFSLAIESSSNPAVIGIDGKIIPPTAETTVNLVLEVTRTSDGTKASTISIPVKLPAKSITGNPDPGSGSQGPSSGSQDPNPSKDKDGKHVVTLVEINKPAENGKVIIPVVGDVKQIALPSNVAQLLGQNQLEIKTDKLTLDVPVDLIKQLTSGLSVEALKDSTISLLFEPLPVNTAKDVIDKGQAESQADLKLSSEIYEFKLSVTKADGSTVAVLSKFNQPITIHLKVDASINPKLAGVYYIAEDGKLEYIGGQYNNGEMVAQINHFSKYAVLEVTKAFTDVPHGFWAADVIKELAAKQIVNGTSATTFEPSRNVTRAEFTSLLVRALKLTVTGQLSFTDVKSNDWYAEAVSIAVKAGIVNGKSETVFDPSAQITREEMVTMVMRAYAAISGNQAASNGIASFIDETQISSWAVAFVNQAAVLHLVQGRAAGMFEPQGITSRAEAAQVIYNLLNK